VKDERVYLLHAIDAIDAITSYTADGHDAFLSDPKTQPRRARGSGRHLWRSGIGWEDAVEFR
jgi:hypothetical protein